MRLGISLNITRQNEVFRLSNLFSGASQQGFTFEPRDITTMYQDRAGTTPVTAVGQSVGLRLSKDQGLALGSEVGSISSGWAAYGATPATVAYSSGVTITNNGTTGGGSFAFASVIGRCYRIAVTIENGSGLNERLRVGNSVGGLELYNQLAGGATTIHVAATATTTYVNIAQTSANLGAVTTVSSFSVRELAGNHEVAINDAARGVYGREPEGGTRNRLTYTEQFDNAAWSKSNVIVTANSLIANAVNGYHGVSISTPLGTVGVLTQQIEAKANGYNWLMIGDSFSSGGGLQRIAFFNIATGNLGAVQGAGVTSTIVPTTDGYFLCTVTFTATNGATSVAVSNADNTRTFTGDGVSGILVRKVQTELGATATAYQSVVSQYDITEAGVASCYYVQTDGVDDAYVTPTITPGTDKAQVFMALKKLNDTGGILMELSASAGPNAGTFYALSGTDTGPLGSVNGYSSLSRGSAAATALQTAQIVQAAPDYAVICATHDIAGDLSTVMRNGVAGTNGTADKGTGNFLAYPVYGYARGGTTLPVAVRDYGHVLRFGPNLDAATIARVNSYLSRNLPTVTL